MVAYHRLVRMTSSAYSVERNRLANETQLQTAIINLLIGFALDEVVLVGQGTSLSKCKVVAYHRLVLMKSSA